MDRSALERFSAEECDRLAVWRPERKERAIRVGKRRRDLRVEGAQPKRSPAAWTDRRKERCCPSGEIAGVARQDDCSGGARVNRTDIPAGRCRKYAAAPSAVATKIASAVAILVQTGQSRARGAAAATTSSMRRHQGSRAAGCGISAGVMRKFQGAV